jgi:hypothetical protein
MKVWNAIMIAVLCALALMYFDSEEKEKSDVGNSALRLLSRDFRLDIGNLRVYRVCVVSGKSGRKAGRKIVKCPVCDQWVRNSAMQYRCGSDRKIERIILVTERKKK